MLQTKWGLMDGRFDYYMPLFGGIIKSNLNEILQNENIKIYLLIFADDALAFPQDSSTVYSRSWMIYSYVVIILVTL